MPECENLQLSQLTKKGIVRFLNFANFFSQWTIFYLFLPIRPRPRNKVFGKLIYQAYIRVVGMKIIHDSANAKD